MSRHTISNAANYFAGEALDPALGKRGLPVMLPMVEDFGVIAVDDNAICLAQQAAAGANLLLNGVIGAGDIGFAQSITLASAGNLSAITFTIRGRDANGYPQACTMAGPNNNTVTAPKTFRQIDSITAGAIVGTNMTVGVGAVVGLKARMAAGNPVVHSDGDIVAAAVYSVGNTTAQTATNAEQRGRVTGVDTESLVVTYYPDRSRDGTGINFVLPDQRVPSVR